MRKVLTTRTVVVLLLATMSLGSYVFLNTVSPNSAAPSLEEKIEAEAKELKALENNVDAVLPDVLLLKKVVEIGKRILPAS